jgi:hypothetical protein
MPITSSNQYPYLDYYQMYPHRSSLSYITDLTSRWQTHHSIVHSFSFPARELRLSRPASHSSSIQHIKPTQSPCSSPSCHITNHSQAHLNDTYLYKTYLPTALDSSYLFLIILSLGYIQLSFFFFLFVLGITKPEYPRLSG